MSTFRVPILSDPNVAVRLVRDRKTIEGIDRLVFRNYVAAGFWADDEGLLHSNKFLHSSTRDVFAVLENNQLVGTMSVIRDSEAGLPSDLAQPAAMRRLRTNGANVAEVSAFAMDRSKPTHRKLVF